MEREKTSSSITREGNRTKEEDAREGEKVLLDHSSLHPSPSSPPLLVTSSSASWDLLKAKLHQAPVFQRSEHFPRFDAGAAPAEPFTLFKDWLAAALDDDVCEPHAVTVCTVEGKNEVEEGKEGEKREEQSTVKREERGGLWPDARVVLLRDVSPDKGFAFGSHRDSAKGKQLSAHPEAALLFYWREQGRQVRVRGRVTEASEEETRREFFSRSEDSQLATLLGRQSEVMGEEDIELFDNHYEGLKTKYLPRRRDHEEERGEREEEETSTKGFTVPYQLYRLQPEVIEFWQGEKSRRHGRLRYRRRTAARCQGTEKSKGEDEESGHNQQWIKERLWP